MHDDSDLVLARIARFARERLAPAVIRERVPLDVAAWVAPGEPVPFADAVDQPHEAVAPGWAWGRPWGTTWFRVTGQVPTGWTHPELDVDLGFTDAGPGFQAEALAFTADGTVLGSVHPRNRHVTLSAGQDVDIRLEAASNPDIGDSGRGSESLFAPTHLGDPATAGTDPIHVLGGIDAVDRDIVVWELIQDVWTLHGMVRELPAALPRRAEVLRALERMVDTVDPDDVAGTAAAGRAALAGVLAAPAVASAHRLHAVGHAHIDSAWLWPVRETVRKVTRTFSSVLTLMDEDPTLIFAASSAQQYAWLAEHQPAVFARLKERVAEGRFVPVGGMWVESDTNMPGGEAMARQFVAGGRFFREQLGVECAEVWLPDSFGYSAGLPQIIAAAGHRYFLTQKTSWNETNTMPHHTFDWEGIDGTRVYTHFPPVDTYNSELSQHELHRAERQYAEKGRANTSLVPFGWGDGGGGPTREMLAAAARTRSLEGSPAVSITTPEVFFDTARAEYPHPPVWSGELYLEFHRGTYTSQARTKKGNRRNEHLLREAELWATTATVRAGADYPAEALRRCWETVLLQQFHDILPGSSIAWVHQEAERNHDAVTAELTGLIEQSLAALGGAGRDGAADESVSAPVDGPGDRGTAATAGSIPGSTSAAAGSAVRNGDVRANAGPRPVAGVPAMGIAPVTTPDATTVTRDGDTIVLDDGRLRAVVDARGLLTSVRDLTADRELIAPGAAGGLLQLFRDTPTKWDAWDIDLHYQRHGRDLDSVESLEVDGDVVRVARQASGSRFVQTYRLVDGACEVGIEVDWHERQKLLKIAFPLDVHADRAASETQFGHVFRATHTNTSWDAARFETCAHRFVHVAEAGYGVAVANDGLYGHDTGRATRADGGTTTTVRVSLLRAPLYPDPTADQGRHRYTVSLRPGDIAAAVTEGYRLNLPLRPAPAAVAPLITVADPAVVVEAVKLAEDGSGDVIVRLYEAHGGRADATVTADFPHTAVTVTDLHEHPLPTQPSTPSLRPFQLLTLRYSR